jgi:hypothetical protein
MATELPKPLPESDQPRSTRRISMSEDDFRWMLMWQGDINRELALFEVERYGLRRARRTMRKFHARRRAFLKSVETLR